MMDANVTWLIRRWTSLSCVALLSACGGAGDNPVSTTQEPGVVTPTNHEVTTIDKLAANETIRNLKLTSNAAGDMLATWTREGSAGQSSHNTALYHPSTGWGKPLEIPDDDPPVYQMLDQQGHAVIMTAYYRLYRLDAEQQQWKSLSNPLATNGQTGELLDTLAGSPLLPDDTGNGILFYVVSETADKFRLLHLTNHDTWEDIAFPLSTFLDEDDTCVACLRISLRRLLADGVGGIYLVFEARRSVNGIASAKLGLYASRYQPATGWDMTMIDPFGPPDVADAFSSRISVNAMGDALLVWSNTNVTQNRQSHPYAQYSQGQWQLGREPLRSPEGITLLAVKKHDSGSNTVLFDDLSSVHTDSSGIWKSHDAPVWRFTNGVDGGWLSDQNYMRIFEDGKFSTLSDGGWASPSPLPEISALSWFDVVDRWTYASDHVAAIYHDNLTGNEGIKVLRWTRP